jgi:hypothetical protein
VAVVVEVVAGVEIEVRTGDVLVMSDDKWVGVAAGVVAADDDVDVDVAVAEFDDESLQRRIQYECPHSVRLMIAK